VICRGEQVEQRVAHTSNTHRSQSVHDPFPPQGRSTASARHWFLRV